MPIWTASPASGAPLLDGTATLRQTEKRKYIACGAPLESYALGDQAC